MLAFTANAQEGSWNGELDVMGTKLPLVFNFSPNGCTMDSPSQNAKGIPAEKTVSDDNSKHTIKKIEGVNHLFQHCTTGNVVEYQQIEETIASEVLEIIYSWINNEL